MKDKSTMSLGTYLFDCIFYMAIAMIWYKNLLFRCLPERTCDESKTVLWVMIGLSIIICAFALNRSMRTGWTVTTALVVPFGLYTVLTYIKTVGNWMLIVLTSAVALSAIYTVLLMVQKIKNRRNKGKVIKRRLHRCCVASQSIVAVALLMVMGIIGTQHRLVDTYNAADENSKGLRIYRPAAQYGQEFSNYIDGDYDFCSYYYQDCEIDARDYAEDAVYDYYDRIFEYLNETSTD